MTISGFDTLFYTLAFLVPGFVWYTTLSVLIPQKKEASDSLLLRLLTLSCLNYAVWVWLIYLLIRSTFFSGHIVFAVIAWTVIILLSPISWGMVSAYFSQKGWIRTFLHKIGFNPLHSIPTAWDYKFSTTDKALWVLVTLKDDTRVGGLFGSRSFASSEPDNRDLFLQEIYKVRDDGPWERVPRSCGILIPSGEMKYIELWSGDQEEKSNGKE